MNESESRAAAAHEVFAAPPLDPAEEARLLARLPVHEGHSYVRVPIDDADLHLVVAAAREAGLNVEAWAGQVIAAAARATGR